VKHGGVGFIHEMPGHPKNSHHLHEELDTYSQHINKHMPSQSKATLHMLGKQPTAKYMLDHPSNRAYGHLTNEKDHDGVYDEEDEEEDLEEYEEHIHDYLEDHEDYYEDEVRYPADLGGTFIDSTLLHDTVDHAWNLDAGQKHLKQSTQRPLIYHDNLVKHGGVGFIHEMPGHPKNSHHLHEELDTYSQHINKHMPSQSKATLHMLGKQPTAKYMLDHPSNRAYGHLTNEKYGSDSSPHAMYGHYMRDHFMPSKSLSDMDLHMHAKPISSKYHRSKTIAYKPMFEERHKQPMVIPHMHKQHRVHKPMYHQFLHSDSTPEQIIYDQNHEDDENEDEEDDKGYLFDSHDGNHNLDDFEDYEIGDHDRHNAELTYPIRGHQLMTHSLKANHARADSKPMHAWNNRAAQKHSKTTRPVVLHGNGLKKGHHLFNSHNGNHNLDDFEDYVEVEDYDGHNAELTYPIRGHQSMIHRLKANHARPDLELMHAWNNHAAQKHSKLKTSRPSVQRGKGLEKEYHHLHNDHDGFENLDDHEEDYEQDEKYPRLFYHGDFSNDAVNHARTASKPMHVWKPNTAQKIQRLVSEKPLMQHDRSFAKGYQHLHNGNDQLEDEYDHEDAYDYEDSEEDNEYEVDEYGLLEDDYEVKIPPFEPKTVYQKIPNKDIDHHEQDMEHNEQEMDQFEHQLSSLFHPRQILKHTGLQPEEFHLDPAEFSIDIIEHDLEPKLYKTHSPKHHWEIAPRSFFKPVGIQDLGGTKQVFPIGHGQTTYHRQ